MRAALICLVLSYSALTSAQDSVQPPEMTFAKKMIRVAGTKVTVDIADSPAKRSYGLMFRKSLEKNHGMLFIFDREQVLGFWMKNTLIPLSIGYFDSKMRLVSISEMVPERMGTKETEYKTYPSAKPAQYALEMEMGWFAKQRIKVGDQFTFVN